MQNAIAINVIKKPQSMHTICIYSYIYSIPPLYQIEIESIFCSVLQNDNDYCFAWTFNDALKTKYFFNVAIVLVVASGDVWHRILYM